MRTLILAVLLFAASPGVTAPPTMDEMFQAYFQLPWFGAKAGDEEFVCIAKNASELGDRILNVIAERVKKGVCI